MWPILEWILVGWTLLAAGCWGFALWLVHRRMAAEARPQDIRPADVDSATLFLSVFKPLAALQTADAPPELIAALESFVRQLDENTELLLGIEEQDAGAWQPVLDAWCRQYPRARLEPVCLDRPQTFLSPKVSWFHALAVHAGGELWFWSDSDIIAPPGLLTTLRHELDRPGTALVTCPYRIRRLDAAPALLETLFVNVEFLPGVLACRQFDAVRFGFGAGLFFRAATFRERVRWEELGERLACDNLLSQRLAPVRLSAVTVDTLPAAGHWRDAALHYLRWKKTVRWCAPVGFAGLIVITPVLGWLVVTALQPDLLRGWLGLLVTIHLEALAAWCICRRLGCSLPRRWAWALVGWSLARALAWGVCWLPWPIVFRSQRRMWWGLYQSQPCGGES